MDERHEDECRVCGKRKWELASIDVVPDFAIKMLVCATCGWVYGSPYAAEMYHSDRLKKEN